MRKRLPDAYDQFVDTARRLEEHYRDIQDLEFTVEDEPALPAPDAHGEAHRRGGAPAAVDMVGEDLITREEAVARIDPAQLDQLLHPMIDPKREVEVVARGLNASPGAACGRSSSPRPRRGARRAGESVDPRALGDDARRHPRPDPRAGVLTAHGGMTSHAAVVARGMGKPCVAGCEALTVDVQAGTANLAGHVLHEGDVITIDGGTGRVMLGEVPLVPPQINDDFQTILQWADELRRLRVHANADTPEDAARRASSAPRASASAGPSTCSWPRTGCRSCAR